MATTYTLISSNVLTSTATSVTFSSIPATYTDLVLKISARNTRAGVEGFLQIQLNAATTNYSDTAVYTDGTTVYSLRSTGATVIYSYYGINGDGATANTFSNTEIYIPNYLAAANKPMSLMNTVESNAAAIGSPGFGAGLWRDTAAITSITLKDGATYNFKIGSSFYLYGISNA